MKRTIAAVLLATSTLLADNAASAGSAATSGGCVEPVPQRNYQSGVLSYALEVDYTDCAWWHGKPIQLEASLSRLDGQGGTGAGSLAVCGPLISPAPSGEEQSGTVEAQSTSDSTGDRDVESASRNGTCSALVWIEHPPVEAALYQGQVTYPWEGGDRTVGFTALCGPTVGCVDLPADPSPALGAGSDVYDAIAGDDSDG